MTTYYVSSEIGSDNNAGTSATAPLATLQDAANLVKAGDTVEVMNGTYTGNAPGGGDVLDITTSGTASAPITFEAAPGQTPVINSSGGWNAINVEASYIVVNGFTVVGDAANYTLAQALAGYSSGNANLDGNGIAINGNHVTIENNTVYNEPGGGIYTEGADYVQILNNVVHDNAHWSAFGNSGISISTSANSDTNAGVHDVVSGNLVFGNAQLVPTTGGNTVTDGEGIILDTNPGYTGEILVENNTVYGNGSSGIESFDTNNAVITSNTVYGNDTRNVQAASVAQIFINQSNNNTVTNNTTTAPNVTPPAAPVISSDVVHSNDSVTLTGTAPDGATVTVSDGGSTPLGTTTASSTGAWSFTTANLAAGTYAFTATDTTSAGTSAASSPFDVTVTSSSSPSPAAPVISSDVVHSNDSVTLTGTAPNGATVTVSDGGSTPLGTTTASSTGAWSYTTADLAAGTYAFTATDTTSAGTSIASNALNVTVPGTSPQPSGTNLVANGNFATGNFTNWTLGGNDSNTPVPQVFVDTIAQGGSTYAAAIGSMGADGTISQTIATTAGQTYTLSFWLQNEGSTANDFQAIWNGQTLLSLTNAAQFGYKEYSYTVTATTSATTLNFSAENSPSQWDLDNISLTANGTPTTPPPAAPVISTGVANANESVALTGTAPAGSTVTVSDGGKTPLGTTTATNIGAWSYTTAALAAGSYAFTATDSTSAGTSAASSAFDVTVKAPPPAAPVIGTAVVNPNTDPTVTLTGTAPAGSTVTVSDGGSTPLGTATASSSGAWSYTTPDLPAGTYAFTATDSTSAGTSAASSAFNVTVKAPPPTAPGAVTVGPGATVEITASDSAPVIFAGSTGMLKLDQPTTFYGTIYNFTGNGSLSGSDQIDLTNIRFRSVRASYANGILTVNGRGQGSYHTETLMFNGSYTLANFKFARDGHGGTIVYDPPVSTSDSQNTNAPAPNATSTGASGSIGSGATLELAAADSESVASTGSKGTFIPDGTSLPGRDSNCATTVSGPGAQNVIDLPDIAFGAQTTLGYLSDSNWAGGTMSVADGTHNANIALLGNYMASSFAMASDGHGGTMVSAEAAQPDQSLLSHPHHA